MVLYKCGHKSDTIIADSNPLTISAYFDWKDTAGFDGDKSLCWDCWNKKEVEKGLQELVRKGYLKKTKKGYIDSDRVTTMLKEGKTRKQISQILAKERILSYGEEETGGGFD